MNTPNLVLILIDDLGWRDLGCTGSDFYETPHIDALAAQGVWFTDAYAASSVCSPSRASMLTGKHPTRVGITDWIGGHGVGALADVPYLHALPENEYSVARALRDAGYRTWHVGKWHLGDGRSAPTRHGFDLNIGGSHVGHPPSYFSPYGLGGLTDGPAGEYLTDRLTDEAIALIESADDRPFFLNLWHYAVHTPIQSPPALIDKYEAKLNGRDVAGDIVEGEEMTAWHLRGRRVRRRIAQSDTGYAAMIENLDDNIGRLMDALRRTGKADDTIIVFTSDNGGLSTAEGSPTCNLPLREGKGWIHDGGTRVPLIVVDPRVEGSGRTSDAITSTPDIYPTLLELAGLDALPAQHIDGTSLARVVRDEPGHVAPPVYWHYPHYANQGGKPTVAVRHGALKLVRDLETGVQRLFDIAADPGETTDLAASGPDSVAELAAGLDAWLLDVGAILPRRNPYPAPFAD